MIKWRSPHTKLPPTHSIPAHIHVVDPTFMGCNTMSQSAHSVMFPWVMPLSCARNPCICLSFPRAKIIGKQWFSWCPFEDIHYRFDLAGARGYAEAPEEVIALNEMGYLKGGTDGVMIVAHGDR